MVFDPKMIRQAVANNKRAKEDPAYRYEIIKKLLREHGEREPEPITNQRDFDAGRPLRVDPS